MNKYAETAAILNDMASVKMAMNSHKGAIEDCPEGAIIDALKSEVAELEQALAKGNLMDILQEAADVQNFLIALTHQKVREYRNRK